MSDKRSIFLNSVAAERNERLQTLADVWSIDQAPYFLAVATKKELDCVQLNIRFLTGFVHVEAYF